MSGHDIESWEKTTAEIEIRRWLVQHNLWAPDAARVFSRVVGERSPEPGMALSTLLPLWPELRSQLGQQIVERTQDDPHFHAKEAEGIIKAFDAALRQLAELTVRLRDEARAVSMPLVVSTPPPAQQVGEPEVVSAPPDVPLSPTAEPGGEVREVNA